MEIFLRNNNGVERYISVDESADIQKEAKKYRTVDNYMVCVIQQGVRILRWDRSHTVNDNHWRKVYPHSFETLGKLPVIHRVK